MKAIAVATRTVHPATGSTSRCTGIATARDAMTTRLLRRSAREGDIRLVSNRTQKLLPRLQLKIRMPKLLVRHAIVDDGIDDWRHPIGIVIRLPDRMKKPRLLGGEHQPIPALAADGDEPHFLRGARKSAAQMLHGHLLEQDSAASERQVTFELLAIDDKGARREERLAPSPFDGKYAHLLARRHG